MGSEMCIRDRVNDANVGRATKDIAANGNKNLVISFPITFMLNPLPCPRLPIFSDCTNNIDLYLVINLVSILKTIYTSNYMTFCIP